MQPTLEVPRKWKISIGLWGTVSVVIMLALALALSFAQSVAGHPIHRAAFQFSMPGHATSDLKPHATFIVTSTTDSGSGSMRQALLSAGPSDMITFDPAVFPPGNPATITLLSPLPTLTQGNLTIDASNAGVVLDGRFTPPATIGLRLTSSYNTIKGMQIVRFPAHGIEINGNAQFNLLGGDWTVGSAPHGEGNIITLNGSNGIDINGVGVMSNTVSGNLIGLDADGTRDLRIRASAISPAYQSDLTLFIATRYHGVWRTVDGGSTWMPVNTGLTISNVLSLAISPNYATDRTLLAGTEYGGLFKTMNGGASWSRVDGGVTARHIVDVTFSPNYASDHQVFAATNGDDALVSTNNGTSWASRTTGLADRVLHAVKPSPNYASDQTLFALAYTTLFTSTDQGATWIVAASPVSEMHALGFSPNFANDQTMFIGTRGCNTSAMFWKSTDGGSSWSSIGGSPGWCHLQSIATVSNYAVTPTLFVGDDWNGIFRSDDGGDSWSRVHASRFNWAVSVSPAYAQDHTVFSGQDTGRVLKSINGGNDWTDVGTTLTEQGNYDDGIRIWGGAQYNTIGGKTIGTRNILSNNGIRGVLIQDGGTDHNTIIGNYIGTAQSGTQTLGNNAEGVVINHGARDNRIGGTTAADRNILSSNGGAGIGVWDSGTMSNTITGNYIGVDVTGMQALGNTYNGVSLSDGARYNRLGGTTEGERNIISANGESGVCVCYAGTMSNTVVGNFIGTDASGAVALGNYYTGVTIAAGSQGNRIGGTTPGERNVVSGNRENGIGVWESGSDYNVISGNYVGVNAGGLLALPNGEAGILLASGAQYNRVGGNTSGERNVVSGNGGAGIALSIATTMSNTLAGNYIGVNRDGAAVIGNHWGIACWQDAQWNTIENNVIGGSNYGGVQFDSCDRNTLRGNFIGTDATGLLDLGNLENGVSLYNGARQNVIGPGNVIAFNHSNGVGVWGSESLGNTITRNSIFHNTLAPLETGEGGNTELTRPVIADATANWVTGFAPVPFAVVEIYSDDFGQGRMFEGEVAANANGAFTLSKPTGLSGPYLTATATDSNGNTTEFSNPVIKPGAAGGDAYEIDDICSQARTILSTGATQNHTFHQTGDIDWISFNAISGTTYLIDANVPSGAPTDLVLEIYQACDGSPQIIDNTFGPGIRLEFAAASTGSLYLKFRNRVPAAYGPQVAYAVSVAALAATPQPGAAIIVAGRLYANDPLQANIHHVASVAFQAFGEHGYDATRIQLLSTDFNLTGTDALPTAANLQWAITTWALDKVGTDRPLTLFIVDHGIANRVYLDDLQNEFVTPQQIDTWLTTLEGARPGLKVNVIIEACYSGSFIEPPEEISKAGRVVIASTGASNLAWSSRNGAAFSDYFLMAVRQGESLYASFESARSAVRLAQPYQTPWLDDNGNGIPNEVSDGQEAQQRGFAYEGTLGQVGWPPYIMEVGQSVTITQGSGQLRTRVTDDVQVKRVWAMIYPPSYQPPASGSELIIETVPSVTLSLDNEDWYIGAYADFTERGPYRVVVYAEDSTGLFAQPAVIIVQNSWQVYLPLIIK